MTRSKRNNSNQNCSKPTKKQRVEAINRLCTEFYPKYVSSTSNYGAVKQLIESNKELYPWLTRNMINKRLRNIKDNIKKGAESLLQLVNNGSIPIASIDVSSDTSLSSVSTSSPINSSNSVDATTASSANTTAPSLANATAPSLTNGTTDSSTSKRGRPRGSTDSKKRTDNKSIKDATTAAAIQWKECRNRGENKPGSLVSIIKKGGIRLQINSR